MRQRTRDLIDLQLFTGARPGELLKLTTTMVDRNGSVWVANLWEHKTRHKGKSRTLYFGPKAQLIFRRYIDDSSHNKRLFPIRRDSYGTTVHNACLPAEVPVWTPHWLLHTAASGSARHSALKPRRCS